MDSSQLYSPSGHVARATPSSAPDDSDHLIATRQTIKHIGALPIVLITIGACMFVGVLGLVIYPAVCERLFGRPSPVRPRQPPRSLWHSPAYVNWGSTPLFKRPDGGLDILQRYPTHLHRKTKSLDVSSRASSNLSAATLVTSVSEKIMLSSALYLGRDQNYGDAELDSTIPMDLGSIFMSTFQHRLSVGNLSTDSNGSTRGIAPASLAYSPGSATWTNSIATLDIRTLYSQRFSRDSVYSQEAPAALAATYEVAEPPARANIGPDRNNSIRYSTESYLTVPGWNVWQQMAAVDDPEAQRAAVYF